MLNNTLFFKQSEIHTISSYANRINDEVKSGDIGYYHLIDTSLNLIDESLQFIQDKEYVKNIVLVGMGLCFFKYFPSIKGSVDEILNFFGLEFLNIDLVLPIGISFYTFTSITYLVEVYQNAV